VGTSGEHPAYAWGERRLAKYAESLRMNFPCEFF
jgi:hypothetical protein